MCILTPFCAEHRTSSQKPGDDLLANFRQQFPEVSVPGQASTVAPAQTTTAPSLPGGIHHVDGYVLPKSLPLAQISPCYGAPRRRGLWSCSPMPVAFCVRRCRHHPRCARRGVLGAFGRRCMHFAIECCAPNRHKSSSRQRQARFATAELELVVSYLDAVSQQL